MLHKTVLKIKDSDPGNQPVANRQKLIYNLKFEIFSKKMEKCIALFKMFQNQ